MTQWLGAAEWIPCVGSAVRLDSRNIHQLLGLFATRHARPARIFGDEKTTETDREKRTRFISCTLFSFSNFIFYSSTNIQRGIYSSMYPEAYAIARITKGEKIAERLRSVSSTESHELQVWKGKSRWWRDSLEERLTDHSYDS